MDKNEIKFKLKKLPDHLIPEVLDYIDFLLNKYGNNEVIKNGNQNRFNFEWEGGLSKLKDQFTSVELQHKAGEWR